MPVHYQIGGASAAAIVASLEAAIRDGHLQAGAQLPAIRALAADLSVSPATVSAAYATLRQRGVIETAGRGGTRVRSRPALGGRGAKLLDVPAHVVDLSHGAPNPEFLPRLGPILARLDPPPVNYRDGGVLAEFAAAATARLVAEDVPVAEIALASGALDAIERLLGAHLVPGDIVGVEDPGWSNLIDLLAALGLRAVPVALDDSGPTVEGVARALAAGARAVIVTSRAQNPTGAALTAERSRALRTLFAEHSHVLVIEDDHSGDLVEVPLYPLSEATRTWAYVRSVSKAYGPDLRLAVVAGDPTTLGRLSGRQRFGTGWVSTLLQRTVGELWRSPEVTHTVAHAGAEYHQRRRLLLDALADRGLRGHGRSGVNVWLPVPDETTAVTRLRDAGWAVVPGAVHRLATPPAIRITVSTLEPPQIDQLADAVLAAVTPVLGRSSV